MAEYTFRRSLSGKLNGEPFPKVGESREVPDSMVDALKSMKFIDDEKSDPEPVLGANVTIPPRLPEGAEDADETASQPETAVSRERATVEAPETADANTPAVKPGDKPEPVKAHKPKN